MSPRRSKRTRAEVSASGPQESTTRSSSVSGAQPLRRSGRHSDVLPPLDDSNRFFKPENYNIMEVAAENVKRLVQEDGPYRTKLLELASLSIDRLQLQHPVQENAKQVVDQAWEKTEYLWAEQSNKHIEDGKATAFASMGELKGKSNFPVIAFSDCFRENDSLIQANGNQILETPTERMTLLLFFRKIKHEFLHIVQRYLEIVYLGQFTTDSAVTPDKYTPSSQQDRNHPLPEVGDHDEEEDSGGPILPLFKNKKLSEGNRLCVQLSGTLLQLTDDHVRELLKSETYFDSVEKANARHDNDFWTCRFSRHFANGVFSEDFFESAFNKKNRVATSGSPAKARLSSPVGAYTTPTAHSIYPSRLWRYTFFSEPFIKEPSNRTPIVSRPSLPAKELG